MQNLWTGRPLVDFRIKIRKTSSLRKSKYEQFLACETSEYCFHFSSNLRVSFKIHGIESEYPELNKYLYKIFFLSDLWLLKKDLAPWS
jgi:hypothetical protein